jgi:hypothetical protein
VSDSDDEEASIGRPRRSIIAASKVVDPSNRSTPALTSHRDAAVAAKRAAAAAAVAAAVALTTGASASGSLSAVASASNSRSVSPGKRNADDAALSSKSRSGSEVGDASIQDKRTGKGKQRGKTIGSTITSVANVESV